MHVAIVNLLSNAIIIVSSGYRHHPQAHAFRCSEMEVKPPAYIFEFLTWFSKLKPDWSIQRHRKGVQVIFSHIRAYARANKMRDIDRFTKWKVEKMTHNLAVVYSYIKRGGRRPGAGLVLTNLFFVYKN